MNEHELRAYALRGLTSRLAELDRERASILTVIADLSEATGAPEERRRRTISPEGRQRIAAAARRRWAARRVASTPEPVVSSPADVDVDVARVLPRRGRLRKAPESAPSQPPLPPMPRLVKHAS